MKVAKSISAALLFCSRSAFFGDQDTASIFRRTQDSTGQGGVKLFDFSVRPWYQKLNTNFPES